MSKLKEITITMRITEEMEKSIEDTRFIMNETRMAGVAEVSKTEAIRCLVIMGQKTFTLEYGERAETKRQRKNRC